MNKRKQTEPESEALRRKIRALEEEVRNLRKRNAEIEGLLSADKATATDTAVAATSTPQPTDQPTTDEQRTT